MSDVQSRERSPETASGAQREPDERAAFEARFPKDDYPPAFLDAVWVGWQARAGLAKEMP